MLRFQISNLKHRVLSPKEASGFAGSRFGADRSRPEGSPALGPETEQRMLEATVAMVTHEGLTVSLDHLSLEDIIRDADVSRSAVYRRWPFKDLFFSDLVKELAKNATPTIAEDEVTLMRQVLTEHLDWSTPLSCVMVS